MGQEGLGLGILTPTTRPLACQHGISVPYAVVWLYRTFRAMQPGFQWYWNERRFGAEYVPSGGPLLVAPNHSSFLDPFLIGALFPRTPIRWLINERWFRRSTAWTWAFRACAVIPAIDGDPEATLDIVSEELSRGTMVGIFPEGRISRDGRVGRGRHGLARIAAATGVPVLPCGLRGAHRSLPVGRWLPRRVPIHLHIGEAMSFPRAPVVDPELEDVAAFTEGLMERIAALADAPRVRPAAAGHR